VGTVVWQARSLSCAPKLPAATAFPGAVVGRGPEIRATGAVSRGETLHAVCRAPIGQTHVACSWHYGRARLEHGRSEGRKALPSELEAPTPPHIDPTAQRRQPELRWPRAPSVPRSSPTADQFSGPDCTQPGRGLDSWTRATLRAHTKLLRVVRQVSQAAPT
jgi:hypothetical protein